MANIRDLKKDINFVLGDIIEAVYVWEALNPETDTKKSEAIIDDAIDTFDTLIAKVNDRQSDNKRQQLKQVRIDLEKEASGLVDRINKL